MKWIWISIIVMLVVFIVAVANKTAELKASALQEQTTPLLGEWMPKTSDPYHDPNKSIFGSNWSLDSCVMMYDRSDFTFWLSEREALEKERRFGQDGLNEDDRKWVMNLVMRERACNALLEKKGLYGPVGSLARHVYMRLLRKV